MWEVLAGSPHRRATSFDPVGPIRPSKSVRTSSSKCALTLIFDLDGDLTAHTLLPKTGPIRDRYGRVITATKQAEGYVSVARPNQKSSAY